MTPEPTDKLDAATRVAVNGPEGDPPISNGSYGLTPPDLKGLLEPDAGRLARPVPRGAQRRKAPGLPAQPQLPEDPVQPPTSKQTLSGAVGIGSAFTAGQEPTRAGGALIGRDDDQQLGVGRQGSAGVREIGYRTSRGLRLGPGGVASRSTQHMSYRNGTRRPRSLGSRSYGKL